MRRILLSQTRQKVLFVNPRLALLARQSGTRRKERDRERVLLRDTQRIGTEKIHTSASSSNTQCPLARGCAQMFPTPSWHLVRYCSGFPARVYTTIKQNRPRSSLVIKKMSSFGPFFLLPPFYRFLNLGYFFFKFST